ncbi:xanthine dehydrogenase accessory factor [Desulfohalotomaculum tongense]|uniref:selenium-dependent molybdenum cofactor biosynthesis protein YqeB n=1 Tax=Desulforadius tongensis TaxID=1216062 RepID=UPI00195B5000|nr:selenium-dependent molybdenum cofactor biosynthesis protein YqeB [Desulforadius tongensis]MBM7855964.1 xanthine dehydrogenase accessory factor [Desulforadius tongensis]
MNNIVLIKGAGDLATGVAHRLFKCGMRVIMTETYRPTVVRRTVSFAEAVYKGSHTVEGVTARLADSAFEAGELLKQKQIPVLIDPGAEQGCRLNPGIIVDAIMAKRNTGTEISAAPIVIGLGPGFTAGVDVHAVVETNRGHHLGRVILSGSAQPDTGIPGAVKGYTWERLLKAPAEGVFVPCVSINSKVKKGDVLGFVDKHPVTAGITGILRGLIKGSVWVRRGMKIGDIDPRGVPEYCYTISDKARAVAGGVLEAVLHLQRDRCQTGDLPGSAG